MPRRDVTPRGVRAFTGFRLWDGKSEMIRIGKDCRRSRFALRFSPSRDEKLQACVMKKREACWLPVAKKLNAASLIGSLTAWPPQRAPTPALEHRFPSTGRCGRRPPADAPGS